ncbi:uncharacterized protein MKK02DRAFT_45006 [Dioszegia hungarica]|uniref:N-acetyltransferase domain-containing protein n=1 Tax=Dioszegia hungarica TaxID=4972 RepID=A0AA38H889_9TREE|nr:uncharacterized protein MKK02DRAFT_45006 [Dioszegia hungarica]KAI9636302.1 hypothetical protein MKK02DRAFT_45006 [Dioszegia hungarica]
MAQPFVSRFAPAPSALDGSTKAAEFYRAQFMTSLGPALVKGEIWTARRKSDNAVVGLAIWSLPGHTMSDTPEQKQYAETYERLISADSPNQKAEADVKKKIKAERDLAYPDLWRNTSHLHILVTLPSSRGTGTGGALLAEFVRHAREGGQGMSLSTPTESNRRFYERKGFKTIWEREVFYPDGKREPYIVMAQDMEG